MEFKRVVSDILIDFDKQNKIAKFIDLLVCWEVGEYEGYFNKAEDSDIRYPGTTHFFRRSEKLIATNDKISVISIKSLLKKINNGQFVLP